ncbi:hypothetical protein N9917_00945 [Deltaproteobacteria bacterium]|nr:hypothetical protein [Deltaproteobacteria bacterium]
MDRLAAYVQLTREEFEDWLDSIGFRGKWKLQQGRGGVYLLKLSDSVAIAINSTTGSRGEVMKKGKASMSLRLMSSVTGRTLNRKAQGQKYFARTLNWRKNWAKGVDRMKDAYNKSQDWYDTIATIADREQYQKDSLALIESIPGWNQDSLLVKFHTRVSQGGVLVARDRATIEKARRNPPEVQPSGETSDAGEDPMVERLRQLWVAANRAGDGWTKDFVRKWAERVKAGGFLSAGVRRILDEKFDLYGV